MREAVIVSYARTGLAKSGRGGFNITPPMSMAAHAIKHAVERAGVDKDYVEDCYLGNCAHGAPQHRPPGRAARRPAEVDRRRLGQPLLLVGPADHRDGRQLRSARTAPTASSPAASRASRSRAAARRRKRSIPDLLKVAPDIFMAMIDTADIVAERYKLSREYQDEYSLESQRRMAAAQQANKFKDEIVPMKTKMKVVDKATKAESIVDYVGRPRRVQPSRDHAGRPRQARAGQGRRQVRHRRQRQPALGRRRRRGADGSQGRREARPQPAGPLRRLGGRPAASPTKWASARSSPCRSC